MRKIEHWRCTEGHGVTRHVGVPEHIEIGNVKVFINFIRAGDRCHYAPVVIRWWNEPLVLCQGTMKLEHEEMFT